MTEEPRPDWVTCVARHGPGAGEWFSHPHTETWCQRHTAEFMFTSWHHAIRNAENAGRLTVCPDCLRAVVNLLENQ